MTSQDGKQKYCMLGQVCMSELIRETIRLLVPSKKNHYIFFQQFTRRQHDYCNSLQTITASPDWNQLLGTQSHHASFLWSPWTISIRVIRELGDIFDAAKSRTIADSKNISGRGLDSIASRID